MKSIVFGLLLAIVAPAWSARVVCYWNVKSIFREGTGKVNYEDIKVAAPHCTHIIYGFAVLDNDDYHIKPANKIDDLEWVKFQWRCMDLVKSDHPGLSVLISVGGYEDHEDEDKYLSVLHKPERRAKFIDSVVSLLREYSFDGVDLAWQFPPQHEEFEKTSISSKLNLGIATWGRSWKLNEDCCLSGTPPLISDGPGEKAPHTKQDGLMSYPEICIKLVSPSNPQAPAGMLRKMQDPDRKLGSYGFRLYDKKSGERGLWVGFEEPDTAALKATWAKQRGFGGVCILDLGIDDAKGICNGTKYPITRAAKLNLDGGEMPFGQILPSNTALPNPGRGFDYEPKIGPTIIYDHITRKFKKI